ncbi:terpene synthase family protein [Dyella sp.]|uniref:terpene synthase family protein n=1 Tax=Dyella sp. TaxID=1869338 RepID=UPI002D781E2C|nr:hypothetical protein [Dyella sp.]HET7332431.1 hypothetical protein [Dyella sp.]
MDQILSERSPHARSLNTEVPPLYCPPPVRIDEQLASRVEDLLMAWIEQVGIFAGRYRRIRESAFGRLAMLCHPDTDDPERLLLQAQCVTALFAVDDYYCDDKGCGAEPALVAGRLSLALAALDPAYLVEPYSSRLEMALNADPVLIGLRSYMQRVQHFATPSQVGRVRYETVTMFTVMAGEAASRMTGVPPPIHEYLAQRQVNSFLPCLPLIDVIGGYELPANLYSAQLVRRATALAGSITVIVNDLYSGAKDSINEIGLINLPGLLAAERGCSHQASMALTADMHDALMREYECAERELLQNATPELARYLSGLRAWMAGNLAWHRTSGRYRIA